MTDVRRIEVRRGHGYSGEVTLTSPDGTRRATVTLPGRRRQVVANWEREFTGTSGRRQLRGNGMDTPAERRAERRFHRLLSAGWTVTGSTRAPAAAPEVEQKPPEDVAEVAPATSQTSEESHGGSEATRDVAGSPNPADDGQNADNQGAQSGRPKQPTQRGSRGGRSQQQVQQRQQERRRQRKRRKRPEGRLQRQRTGGGSQVWSPQPLTVTPQIRQQARRSGQLLTQLVGARGARAVPAGTEVDTHQLLLALETGDDPLPALERPRQRPRTRVLVTPDSSGSCQGWSGLGRAWALHLAGQPDVDVIYVDNFNGALVDGRGRSLPRQDTLLAGVDVVVYLGDRDGYDDCVRFAEAGALVVALDNHCASTAAPRVDHRLPTRAGGELVWVDRVSARDPQTWTAALRRVLSQGS